MDQYLSRLYLQPHLLWQLARGSRVQSVGVLELRARSLQIVRTGLRPGLRRGGRHRQRDDMPNWR